MLVLRIQSFVLKFIEGVLMSVIKFCRYLSLMVGKNKGENVSGSGI